MDLLLNSTRLKEELMQILFKLFYEMEKEGTLSNSFCEDSITLTPKPDKHMTRKENEIKDQFPQLTQMQKFLITDLETKFMML
jgi:hypothetical protein